MEIAVCEDEKLYADLIIKETEKYFVAAGERPRFSVFSDGLPLVAAYKDGRRFDIIFLDIQLENSDGVEVAGEIRRTDGETAIIFITGLDDRATEGYAVSAFDYIVKRNMKERLPAVLDRLTKEREKQTLTVPAENGGTDILRFSEIICAESSGRGTVLHTARGDIKSAMPISRLAALLPPDKFIEIHKSIYVRVEDIRRVGIDTAEMSDGEILPISRRRRKAVMSEIMRAVKGNTP